MALKATVFRADLQIADMDRNLYQDDTLTIARHPSETDRRLMVRILAYALNARENLTFTRGLSTDDEPDLWCKSLSDEILLWIDLGQPDEKRIRKACGRSREVSIYSYSDRSARVWFDSLGNGLERFERLRIYHLPESSVVKMAALAQRNMKLQCTIQDDVIWLGDAGSSVQIEPERWK
ncbi:MAG: YaeQ family protein [Gammaproteobacteria bacterium]|nr:YaeQ family protein [Gammaproteobacteria bacterium]